MTPVPLEDAADASRFGGKAAALAAALRAGLPVPPGVAFAAEDVERLGDGEGPVPFEAGWGDRLAVRSSAVGEDGAQASFAGQHATILGVSCPRTLRDAIRQVWRSARTDAALAYRARLGIPGPPRMGVVAQRLLAPTAAGVLFTKNPLSGVRERVVEAAWGLGEAVVAGLVTPDHFRVSREGRILERRAGEKDLEIGWADGGGTEERPVPPDRAAALCLDDAQLLRLHELARVCERAFGDDQDLEWAFVGDALFLLQHRPITR